MISARTLGRDIALVVILALVLAGFAIWLLHMSDAAIPRRNVYFNADTDRVLANLIDRNSNHVRLNVHPLFGLVCIAFQKLFGMDGDIVRELEFWSGMNGALMAAAMYVAVRAWGGRPPAAAAAALLAGSSAGFVYWAAITETHMLGGLTVLALAILWRVPLRSDWARIVRSGAMFAIGASVIITNVVAWGLSQLRLEGLWARRPRALLADNLGVAGLVGCGALAGLGLLTLGAAVQDFILRNDSVPPLLRLWSEAKYVSVERGTFEDLLNVLALVYSHGSDLWLVNLAMAGALLWAAVTIGADRAFMALWALFGLALHSIYDRAHGFLFAPNYLPLGIVALALAVGQRWPRGGAVAMAAAALCLAPINIMGYLDKRAATASQSDAPGWYAPLRAQHPVPKSNIVRPADPPVGFDQ